MKKLLLMKTILLLCALVVGSSNLWAVTKPWSGDDPASTLNLQTITSSAMGTWNGTTSWYLDDDYLVVSGYESYKSVSNQTWITQVSAGNSSSTWNASTPFKGSSYYTNANYTTIQSGRYLLYKVTNLKSLKVYGKNNSTSKYLDIFIYTKSGDDYTKVEEIKYTTDANNHIWANSVTLSPANTYYIYITAVGSSNSRVFEVAFERNTGITKHTLSSAVSPASSGTVTLGATQVGEGKTTTISATANPGYVFENWSVSGTGASVTDASAASTTFTMGTTNATVTANFTAVTTHEIKWSVNGNIVKTEDVNEGDALSFAAPASGIPAGLVFQGWVVEANKINTPTDTDPSANYVTSATSTADITYYAVMAIQTGREPSTLTKMVKGNTFSEGDKIVVVAKDGSDYYALYQETTNSSYVKNYSFTESAASVESNDKNWWTVSAGATDGKWKLGDATNGYLYSSGSNNLSVDKNNSTDWSLVDNEDGTFSLDQGRYLSCRSDLSGDNQYLYRLAGGTPAGVYKLTLYKYVLGNPIYASYCTTVPATTTVTLAAACTDGDFYYGTYSNYRPFVVPSDLIVSEIKVVDGKLSISDYDTDDVVPANTGVMISSDESGSHTLTFADVAGTSKLGANNMLKASSVAMTGDNKFYRLTMHNGTTIGFWWGAANGAAFDLGANKAYLAIPNASEARAGLWFGEGGVTAIETVKAQNAVKGEYFNLAGQRVAQPTKGLYIVNGRKVIVK